MLSQPERNWRRRVKGPGPQRMGPSGGGVGALALHDGDDVDAAGERGGDLAGLGDAGSGVERAAVPAEGEVLDHHAVEEGKVAVPACGCTRILDQVGPQGNAGEAAAERGEVDKLGVAQAGLGRKLAHAAAVGGFALEAGAAEGDVVEEEAGEAKLAV